MSKLKFIDGAIWVVLGLIMLVPTYVNSDLLFPFISSKAIVFRILTELLLLLWLARWYLRKDSLLKVDWLSIVFALFLVSLFVSSLIGGNFYFSFWSNTERSEGLLLWLHLFIWFLVLRNFINSKKEWSVLWDIFFLAAQVVAVFGFLQYLGIDLINKSSLISNDRVASTIGNAAYTAGYLLFAVFAGAYLALQRKSRYLSIYYILGILLDIFIIFQSGTRGALIALLVSILVFIVYNLLRLPQKKIKYSLLILGLIFVGFLSFAYINKGQPWVQNSTALTRLTSISLGERTMQTRFMAWGSAWQGFKEKPIFGWGAENFYRVFNKYYNPNIFAHAGAIIWFDRAHNIFLDHLVTGGLVGFILYLFLILGPLYILGRKVLQLDKGEPWQAVLSQQILFLMALAFVIQGLVVFEALVTYLPLLLLLAMVAQKYIEPRRAYRNNKIVLISFIVYLLAFVPIMYFVNWRETKANLTFIQALRLEAVDTDKSFQTFIKAMNYHSSGSNEFLRQLVEFSNHLLINKKVTPYVAMQYTEKIDALLKQRQQADPFDAANYLLAMRHYNYTYILDVNRLYEVDKLGQEAIKYSPTRQQFYYEMGYGELYLYLWMKEQGKIGEAKIYQDKLLANFQKAIDLNPYTDESYVNMVMALLPGDMPEKIQSYIDQMDALGIDYKKEKTLNRLANSAVYADNFSWAVNFYSLLTQNYQDNPEYWISLALSYANIGEKDKAIAIAGQIKKFGGNYETEAVKFIEKVRTNQYVKQTVSKDNFPLD
ncbi:MAG: O-antigen ligase family protein [Patescibacteria group bacterium]